MKTSTFLQITSTMCAAFSTVMASALMIAGEMTKFEGYVMLIFVSASAIANIISLIVKKYEE